MLEDSNSLKQYFNDPLKFFFSKHASKWLGYATVCSQHYAKHFA